MARDMTPREVLTIVTPNRAWVVNALDELLEQWRKWLQVAENLPDSPDYDPRTCSEAIKDGFANRRKHEIMREKTLVFIGNNFTGYDFLFANWPWHPHEANTERLSRIVPGWLHRLEILSASIEYARVADGFWTAKGKQLVEEIVKVTPDKGAEIAASWLKNPMNLLGGA